MYFLKLVKVVQVGIPVLVKELTDPSKSRPQQLYSLFWLYFMGKTKLMQ